LVIGIDRIREIRAVRMEIDLFDEKTWISVVSLKMTLTLLYVITKRCVGRNNNIKGERRNAI